MPATDNATGLGAKLFHHPSLGVRHLKELTTVTMVKQSTTPLLLEV
jgi:hypothetical protein